MLLSMKYSTSGADVLAAMQVADEKYTETWSRFKPEGQVFTATPIITQVRTKLFNNASVSLVRAVNDVTDLFESLYTAQKPPVEAMLSFIAFIEGISQDKIKCTAEDFAKLRGYVDILGTVCGIDKSKVYASLIDHGEISATTELEETTEIDDIKLANDMLSCLLTNRQKFDALYTVLEDQMQTYSLADTYVYFNRALPELIGHIRGDLYGRYKEAAIKRCLGGNKVEDILSFIGTKRILNFEVGVAKVLLVVAGLTQVYNEVTELYKAKKIKPKKVLKDIEGILNDLATNLANKSYDFEASDIQQIVQNPNYNVDEIAHILLAGSIDDIV